MNGTISTPGGNSWLCTLTISNMVAQWSNMSTCKSSYHWYLKKSSINMRCTPLKTIDGCISKFKREFLAWRRQETFPMTAWKNIWKILVMNQCAIPLRCGNTPPMKSYSPSLWMILGWSAQTGKMRSTSEMPYKYYTPWPHIGQGQKIGTHPGLGIHKQNIWSVHAQLCTSVTPKVPE